MAKPKIAEILNIAKLAANTVQPGKSVDNYKQRISQAFKGADVLDDTELEKLIHRIEYGTRLAVKHLKTIRSNRAKREAEAA